MVLARISDAATEATDSRDGWAISTQTAGPSFASGSVNTPTAGIPALREAIAAKTLRDSGYSVTPAQVLVTNGGKQAVYQTFAALLDAGDEALLPAPYWTTYPESIALAGHRSAVREGRCPFFDERSAFP